MNEQLQKLYEQSFVTDSYVNVGPDGAELGIKFDPEKFAELIVRECAKVIRAEIAVTEIDGESERAWEMGMECGVGLIKKHFGVEE
jgi:hypothetical protein